MLIAMIIILISVSIVDYIYIHICIYLYMFVHLPSFLYSYTETEREIQSMVRSQEPCNIFARDTSRCEMHSARSLGAEVARMPSKPHKFGRPYLPRNPLYSCKKDLRTSSSGWFRQVDSFRIPT